MKMLSVKGICDYNRALNGEIIRQMVERGYKYSVCEEDIEFWKEKQKWK